MGDFHYEGFSILTMFNKSFNVIDIQKKGLFSLVKGRKKSVKRGQMFVWLSVERGIFVDLRTRVDVVL